MTTSAAPASLGFRSGLEPGPLLSHFRQVREFSEQLCAPLQTEDFVVQSMEDASPLRWHLGHTTWFFETFVLASADPSYKSPHPEFAYLFNSYYVQAGERYPRPRRGLITRPTVRETFRYRAAVDEAVGRLLEKSEDADVAEVAGVIELGIHHEQQHQELMLTDLKHALSFNPLFPVFRETAAAGGRAQPGHWVSQAGGIQEVGHGGDGFCFDNEQPRHRVLLEDFELFSRPVTNGEYLEFMRDGAYDRETLWLSDAWPVVQQEGWRAPLYWLKREGEWHSITLAGLRPVDPNECVAHVSFYEAEAFARWAGARLPTEAEWEVAAGPEAIDGNFVESERFHPAAAGTAAGEGEITQLYGDVWEWTASPYVGYPGYRPPAGALGEYNGKFMANQMVLRGGSCATPQSHIRATYRNFFHPPKRWQFSGLRLAR